MAEDDEFYPGPEYMREAIDEWYGLVGYCWDEQRFIAWTYTSSILLGFRIRLWLLEQGWIGRGRGG